MKSPPYRGLLAGLGIIAATLLAYLPAWRAGFVWDDDVFLVNNPLIHDPEGLRRFWFSMSPTDFFPMTSSMLWLEWRLWGSHPLGYHVINVLLHGLNAVLVWRILRRLMPGFSAAAWLAAALFAVHPVNVQSVAWITERKNTLAMFFLAASLLWYLKFEDAECAGCYWAALGGFSLALLSKTAVAPLPLLLLGLAWWRRGRIDRRDLLRSLPFFAAAALVGLLALGFQLHHNVGSRLVRADGFWSRLAGAGCAIWFYLAKGLFPLKLIPVYPRWQIAASNPISCLPDLLMLAILGLCWRYRRTGGRGLLMGLGAYVVMLLPALGFVNIYFMRYSLVADHWQYFALPALMALAAMAITWGVKQLSGATGITGRLLIALPLVTFGTLTWKQTEVYRDARTLWETILERNPQCFLAHNNLGNALLDEGRVDEAIAHFQDALRTQPDFAPAENSLGNAMVRRGDTVAAIAHFQNAVELQPDYAAARNNLANLLLQTGRIREALAQYQEALDLGPDSPALRVNFANALLQDGQLNKAINEYQTALTLNPGFSEAANHLLYLAWVMAVHPQASLRNGARAVELALQAERHFDREDPIVTGTLAAAYAEAGRFGEAIAAAERSLALANAQSNPMTNALEVQIQLYRAGRPFRDASLTNAPESRK